MTMRSALKVLLQEGWIVSKERSGYYVAKQRIQKDVSKIESTSYTTVSYTHLDVYKRQGVSTTKIKSDLKVK